MTFRSKVDLWLALVLLASVVAALIGAFTAFHHSGGWVSPMLIALLGAGLPVWIITSTKYTVAAGSVDVQCGPFRWHIPGPNVIKIFPTRSVISSPALSLDRLHIEYEQGGMRRSLLVSPLQQGEFIRAVETAKTGTA